MGWKKVSVDREYLRHNDGHFYTVCFNGHEKAEPEIPAGWDDGGWQCAECGHAGGYLKAPADMEQWLRFE